MLGTVVNVIAIVGGVLIGIFLRKEFRKNLKRPSCKGWD